MKKSVREAFPRRAKKYYSGIVLSGVVPFAVFTAAVLLTRKITGMPGSALTGREWGLLLVGLLSVAAGNCVLGALLCAVKGKKLTALLAVPLVFCLFIVSMNFGCHLFESATVESFDYFYAAHADALEEGYEGECYYDDGKNVIILNGAEYPSETVANPDRYTGIKRAGALLFELADPIPAADFC